VSSEPTFFVRPEGTPTQLRIPPRLASWNVAGHPDQRRLAASLDDAEQLLTPTLSQLTGSVALRLDVGLADHHFLLNAHDLDNYALPLAHRLTSTRSLDFVSIWSTKAAAATSLIRCEAATPASLPGPFDYRATLHTTASASTTAYKQQISDQLTGAAELPPGPIALELAFVVGPRRNWQNLWKPTIDALDRLLGRTHPDREWHPRDGRITELALHRTIDEALGNDVVVTVASRAPDLSDAGL
jgi:hypothetical protein